jgi:hypothetical protein
LQLPGLSQPFRVEAVSPSLVAPAGNADAYLADFFQEEFARLATRIVSQQKQQHMFLPVIALHGKRLKSETQGPSTRR